MSVDDMKVKKGQHIEVQIEDIAFGGLGIARVNGLTVFVDQAVPHDRIRAVVVKKKKQFAVARVIEILEASPYRIDPPCPYSGYCGGCKWQFLMYDQQLRHKQRHVAETLQHIGGISEVAVHTTIPSDLVFGYRNKMEFSCSNQRWLLPEEMGQEGVDKGFALGLHVPGTFDKIIDTQACLLQPELGNQILREVSSYLRRSGRQMYGIRSHTGFWRFLMLRNAHTFGNWMVNFVTTTEDRKEIQPLADRLIEKYPQVVSVVNNIASRKASVALGEYEIRLAGDSSLKEKIGAYEFEISANSFFQTNTRGAEQLYAVVKDYASLSGTEAVLDLYSGTGAISIFLADSAKKVLGIEINKEAVTDAERNCRRNMISNGSFIHADVRRGLPELSFKPDVMIIDPPRAGMHKDVVTQVMKMLPHKIVYVSCNPATLARDLGIIKECYDVFEVQPIDMFPHTPHIESVARLERKE